MLPPSGRATGRVHTRPRVVCCPPWSTSRRRSDRAVGAGGELAWANSRPPSYPPSAAEAPDLLPGFGPSPGGPRGRARGVAGVNGDGGAASRAGNSPRRRRCRASPRGRAAPRFATSGLSPVLPEQADGRLDPRRRPGQLPAAPRRGHQPATARPGEGQERRPQGRRPASGAGAHGMPHSLRRCPGLAGQSPQARRARELEGQPAGHHGHRTALGNALRAHAGKEDRCGRARRGRTSTPPAIPTDLGEQLRGRPLVEQRPGLRLRSRARLERAGTSAERTRVPRSERGEPLPARAAESMVWGQPVCGSPGMSRGAVGAGHSQVNLGVPAGGGSKSSDAAEVCAADPRSWATTRAARRASWTRIRQRETSRSSGDGASARQRPMPERRQRRRRSRPAPGGQRLDAVGRLIAAELHHVRTTGVRPDRSIDVGGDRAGPAPGRPLRRHDSRPSRGRSPSPRQPMAAHARRGQIKRTSSPIRMMSVVGQKSQWARPEVVENTGTPGGSR